MNHSEIIKLRSFIGYVSQEDVFMNASIKDNIVWGSDFDIKHLNYIINLVGINKIISNLSNGLDTEISATGFVLSGGERQKLALARALYRRPKILILDEATSALDEQSEIEIMNIVYELKNIQSSIIISHNYKTLWGCEKIYIVEDGKILKSGPWAKI